MPELAYLQHDGLIRDKPDAALYSIRGKKVWFPKSQIKDSDDKIIVVPQWLCSKKGLVSDW